MKSYYFTFRSVTFAQRGEKVLNAHQIRCSLLRTPRWMETQGCGYALKIWTREPLAALELLHQSQIPVRRVYVQQPDGQLEEVTL